MHGDPGVNSSSPSTTSMGKLQTTVCSLPETARKHLCRSIAMISGDPYRSEQWIQLKKLGSSEARKFWKIGGQISYARTPSSSSYRTQNKNKRF